MSGVGKMPFSLDSAADLFKIKYGERSEAAYNAANILLGRIRNKNDFGGEERVHTNPLGFAGGIGSGELPSARSRTNRKSRYGTKKVYARAYIEREAIYASKNMGAFVDSLREVAEETVEAHARHMSVDLYNRSSGVIGRGDGATAPKYQTYTEATDALADTASSGKTASDYIKVKIDSTPSRTYQGFVEAWFEEGDVHNLVIGNASSKTNRFEVFRVLPDSNEVVYKVEEGSSFGTGSGQLGKLATDGTAMPKTTGFCFQNSFNKEPVGLEEAIFGTGSLYGIPRQRRWQALVIDARSGGNTTGIDHEVLNELVTKQAQRKSLGNMIVTSYVQTKRLKDLSEGGSNDLKRYNIAGRKREGISDKLQQKISFSGTSYISEKGEIPIFADRFCPPDRLYFLNDSQIWCDKRPGAGWFMDDGTRFLRVQDQDAYEARYGVYCENYIKPTWHAALHGLTTSY